VPCPDQGDNEVRKVVAYELLSLDGVAENPDEFITNWDDAMGENLARVIAPQDTVLLGHRTYDDWSAFWPPSDIEPFATFINGVKKFAAASTTPALPWANATVINSDFSEFVTELKQQSGGDIGVHGSIALVQSLLKASLVNELRLVIAPSLQMHGRRLFDKALPIRLELTRTVTSPTGYLLLDYRVGA
jgi:dihydrofolate reductase